MTIIAMSIIADAQIALRSALALFGSEPMPVGCLVVALAYPQSFLKTEGKIVLAAAVEIKGIDRKGMNFYVAKVITDELDINIHRFTVTADEGIFDGSIELRVHDRSNVKLIMDRLKKVDGIQEGMRIN
mgnify:CR=1 FL=1